MKIAIDIDNTICKTTEFFGDVAIKFDREILKKNNAIDFNKVIPRSLDWSKDELQSFLQIYFKELINVPILEEANKYINKFKDLGFYIVIITARGEKTDDYSDAITPDYLAKNNIQYDELIVKCSNKYKYLNDVDFFIDDSMHECDCAIQNTKCKVIMMKNKLNYSYKSPLVYKANGWEEIYNYIVNCMK